MRYQLFFEHPNRQLIRVQIEVTTEGGQPFTLGLSKWRPGRYEFADYAEKVVDVVAWNEQKAAVSVEQISSHEWRIMPKGAQKVTFEYKFYAVAPDAGGSWFDESWIYFNPINLLMYRAGALGEPSEMEVHLPENYQVACSMERKGNVFFAPDFHVLVDSPFLAAADLQHVTHTDYGTTFHLWFQGLCKPDFDRILKEFSAYTRAQIELFGDFPVKEYHYLFIIPIEARRHGVEHQRSTVIALGPAHQLMEPSLYEEFLGISSHELFHTWNVKAIRPADMQPYRYHEANYSKLHYITEGVTTYYGDLMLMKGGVWSAEEFCRVFSNSNMYRVFSSGGHRHISLENASFTSWVNGYKAGVPNRKISFYSKGAMVAFMLDIEIRKATGDDFSLDDVMYEMYQRFGKTGKGYTKADYKGIAEQVSGTDLTSFFEDYISGTTDLLPGMAMAAEYIGLRLQKRAYLYPTIKDYGFFVEKNGGTAKISTVLEGFEGDLKGLTKGDEIVAVNGVKATADTLQGVLSLFNEEPQIDLKFFRAGHLQSCILIKDPQKEPFNYALAVNEEAGSEALAHRKSWMQVKNRVPKGD